MALFIFLSAFVIRVLVQWKMGVFTAPQTWEYEVVVNNYLAGAGLSYSLYGTTYYSLIAPLYPLLCIIIYSLTNHSFLAVAIIQAAISAFTCVVIFWLGSHIFGKKAGLLAAIITALHPGAIVYTAKFHSFVLDSLLFCLIVWLLIKTKKNPVIMNELKLGAAFGLALLTRATVFIFLPLSWLWLKRNTGKSLYIYILVSLLLLSPWVVRNYIIYKKPVILTSSSNVFWRGNNPLATGTSLGPKGLPMLQEDRKMYQMLYGKSEIEQNNIFWQESIRFIRNNPLRSFKLFIKKLYYFFWFAPTTGSQYQPGWLNIYKIYYSVMVIFGILGLLTLKNLSASSRNDAVLIILFILVIAVAQSLFYVETRHRWAIEPLMLIFSAAGMIRTKEILKKCLIKKI